MKKRQFKKIHKQIFRDMDNETYMMQKGWTRAQHKVFDKVSRRVCGGVIKRGWSA